VQAAESREQWREEQGAVNFQMPEAKIQVVQPHSPASRVQVHASGSPSGNQASQRLVSEMMILAGQAIASIGIVLCIVKTCMLQCECACQGVWGL